MSAPVTVFARALCITGSAPPPRQLSPTPGQPAVVINVVFTGTSRITGTVKNEAGAVDTPVYRRVRLHDQPTGRAVREVWSDAVTGAYAFDYIAAGKYFVVTFDHTGQYSAVIESDITPEPMP